MKNNDSQKICYIDFYYIILGIASLSLGSLIYIIDRPPEAAYFVKNFLQNTGNNLQKFVPEIPDNIFGTLGSSMPSFLHTFAFTLITGSFIKESKKGFFISAVIWLVINILFETGQYFKNSAVALIPKWFDKYIFLETLDEYFIAGTFDVWDIAAVFAGAVMGYVILVYTNE